MGFLGPLDPPPGGGKGNPRTPQKSLVGNNTPTFIFDIFKIIGIRNSLYILRIYSYLLEITTLEIGFECALLPLNLKGYPQGMRVIHLFIFVAISSTHLRTVYKDRRLNSLFSLLLKSFRSSKKCHP